MPPPEPEKRAPLNLLFFGTIFLAAFVGAWVGQTVLHAGGLGQLVLAVACAGLAAAAPHAWARFAGGRGR